MLPDGVRSGRRHAGAHTAFIDRPHRNVGVDASSDEFAVGKDSDAPTECRPTRSRRRSPKSQSQMSKESRKLKRTKDSRFEPFDFWFFGISLDICLSDLSPRAPDTRIDPPALLFPGVLVESAAGLPPQVLRIDFAGEERAGGPHAPYWCDIVVPGDATRVIATVLGLSVRTVARRHRTSVSTGILARSCCPSKHRIR